LRHQRWIGICLALILGAWNPGRGEGLNAQAVESDFDGDGITDLYIVDPGGRGRFLSFEEGALRERTHEMGLEGQAAVETGERATGTLNPIPISPCGSSIRDRATVADCLKAGSAPKLGRLYPLSTNLFVDTTGKVGIGTTSPASPLSVNGAITSVKGGFRFPDGTLQVTATPPGPTGPQGPQGPAGPTGPTGPAGASGFTALNNQFGPALSVAGAGAASVSASGSTVTVSAPTALCVYANRTYSGNAFCFTAGNSIGCSFGFNALKLKCRADGSWQVITSSQCFNPSAGPICGFPGG
jgi:hypothetical protein